MIGMPGWAGDRRTGDQDVLYNWATGRLDDWATGMSGSLGDGESGDHLKLENWMTG